MKMGFKLPLAMALLAFAGAASASVTALTVMPIADVLKHREVVIGYSISGNERNIDKDHIHYAWTTIGIGDGLEFAYGNDLRGQYTLHAKAQLYSGKNCALSIGAMNFMGDGLQCDTFVVGRYDMPGYRLHAGYQHDTEHRGIFGMDCPIFGNCTLMLEWKTGPSATGWYSVNIPIKQLPGWNIQLGGSVPADHHEGYQHTAILWWGGKF